MDQSLKDEDQGQNPHLVEDQKTVEAFLSSPDAFPGKVDHVDRIDTYGAMLFLAGDCVFKVKRAVLYPYMDFSTLAKRKAVCLNELTLNRRTAPTLYTNICCICRRADGTLTLHRGETPPSNTEVVEWCIEMKRFDEDQRLDHLAERSALTDQTLKTLADNIAEFHATAEVYLSAPNNVDALARIIQENTEAFREFPAVFSPDRVDALSQHTNHWLQKENSHIVDRQHCGHVRHCHGDLHLANIVCLNNTPTLFDALEFDDNMACIDVFYDLAFLLMDFWERGYPQAANLVLNQYLMRTADYEGLSTLPLYLSIRAAIRAKIAAAQSETQKAQEYFFFVERFLKPGAPTLIAIGGLSGTGKSTLGKALAHRIGAVPGAVHLRSDIIRKSLLNVSETTHLGNDAYTPQLGDQVYKLLQEKAQAALAAGQSVITDAVYAAESERHGIAAVAKKSSVPFIGLWLEAPVPVLLDRVRARHGDASDADETIIKKQVTYDLGKVGWHRLNTDEELDALVTRAKDLADLRES